MNFSCDIIILLLTLLLLLTSLVKGSTGVYGMVANIPDKAIIDDFIVDFFSELYTPDSTEGQNILATTVVVKKNKK